MFNEFQKHVLTKYQHYEGETWYDIINRMQMAIQARNSTRVDLTHLRSLLENRDFMPGGSIIYGLGKPGAHPNFGPGPKNTISLSNCVVQTIREDSMDSITETVARSAKCYQYRMGVGTDLSVLRPMGDPVHNSAKSSSGAASFMSLLSSICGTVGQQGRRGALMLTLDVNHPDIFQFITAKMTPGAVTNANISVKISDEFMQAVENDDQFDLQWPTTGPVFKVYKTIRAKDLWELLIDCSLKSAEPGALFWDRILERPHGLYEGSKPITTNPCSEIPLPDDDVCLLGSLYLPSFVDKPYTENAQFNFIRFSKAISTSIRFLDIVKEYDIEMVPYKAIKDKGVKWRRIGLGTHGLSDTFWRLGVKYGSKAAASITDSIYRRLMIGSYSESILLSEELGPFPGFDPEIEKGNQWLRERLPSDLFSKMLRVGRRHIALNTIAPTGSISVLSNNCSSGIEPPFDYSYLRFAIGRQFHDIPHGEMLSFKEITSETNPRSHMVIAKDLTPTERVTIQSKASYWLDHACSSTVNFFEGASKEIINEIFFKAWKTGCQGITVYVEGSRMGVVNVVGTKRDRPSTMNAKSFKFGGGAKRFYINVSVDERGNPMEVFLSSQISDKLYGLDMFPNAIFRLGCEEGLHKKLLVIDERLSAEQYFCVMVSILLTHNVSPHVIINHLEEASVGSLPFCVRMSLIRSLPENSLETDINCPSGNCE